jgi:6-pyruvoyltetrahydropterin/6-carboxytetrahydropterin synthase
VYEVGTGTNVRAFHIMPGMEGPEGQLHDHDYRLDVVVRRQDLDDRGMVCDLDALDAALRRAAEEVADRDLDRIRPPEAEAVTVEVFSRWLFTALAPTVAAEGGGDLQVRVWESPVAFGGYAAPVAPEPSSE